MPSETHSYSLSRLNGRRLPLKNYWKWISWLYLLPAADIGDFPQYGEHLYCSCLSQATIRLKSSRVLTPLRSSRTTVDTERHNELMLYFEGVNKARNHSGFTFLQHYQQYMEQTQFVTFFFKIYRWNSLRLSFGCPIFDNNSVKSVKITYVFCHQSEVVENGCCAYKQVKIV